MKTEDLKCEVCGKPATCAVRDLTREWKASIQCYFHKPCSPVRLFCDEHDREPEMIDISADIVIPSED